MNAVQSMLRTATGLNLSKSIVDRAIKNRMEKTAAANQDAYLEQMTPEELTALVELVVVPESWFFRDHQAFVAATDFVRARLAADGNRRIRILSIPCAGGEEPYTIAMALTDVGVPLDRFIIDGIDISPGCVERASSGIYGRNAFRNKDLSFRDRHFTPIGNEEYRVSDAIRKQVRLKQGNLLEFSPHAGGSGYYDVIFCRNLLIYFDKPTTKAAINKLDALLMPDGLLFAGYAEVPSFCLYGFTPIRHAQSFGLMKESAVPPKEAKPALAPVARRGAAPVAKAPAPPRAPAARASAAPPPAVPAKPAAPTQPPTANMLAEARELANMGRLKEADRKCLDYLAQMPDSAEAYFILGLLNELTNQPEQAAIYWRRCIYLQPDHYEALCHLALLAETNNDPAGAAALKARAARIYKRQQAS